MSKRWVQCWPYAMLVLLVFALYAQALWFPFVSWDDPQLLTHNPAVQSITPATLWTIFSTFDPELYIPFTFLSYQIEHQIVGLEPFLYHLDNILLHAVNACLVFALLARWCRSRIVGLLLAIAFAVHPLNVEAVAWISARKDVLSTAFVLASLLLYERSFDDGHKRWAFAGSVVFFLFSLLAKPGALLLPFVLLLLDYVRKRRIDRRSMLEKIPLVVLSIVFGIVALFGKSDVRVTLSFGEQCVLIVKAIFFSVAKFLWPHPLSIIYPASDLSLLTPSFIVPIMILGLVWLWNLWKNKTTRRKGARNGWERRASVGLLITVLLLLPSILVPKHAGVHALPFDKYLYLPMLGLLLTCGTIVQTWASWGTRLVRAIVCGVAIVLLVICASMTLLRLPVWASGVALYSDAVARFPTYAHMHNNLGKALSSVTEPEKVEGAFRRAIALDPTYADAYANLGIFLLERGRTEEGLSALREATRLGPEHAVAHNALGFYYLDHGSLDEAIVELKATLAINPDFLRARYSLITAYSRKGMMQEAQEETRYILNQEDE